MPEAPQVIHDTKAPEGDLDAGVSALLADLAPSPPSPDPTSQPAAPAPAAPAPAPNPAPDAAAEDHLLAQVQELLAEAGAPPADQSLDLVKSADLPPPSAAAAPPAAPRADTIESLDSELADLADDIITDEFKDDPRPEPEPASEPPEPPAPQPSPTPIAAPAPAPRPIPRPPKPEPPRAPKPEPTPAPLPPRRPGILKRTLTALDRATLQLAATISRPLNARPAHVRDIVGWNALWIAFLAVCLWGYVLFIRSPEPPIPSMGPDKAHAAAKPASQGDDHKPAAKSPPKAPPKTASKPGPAKPAASHKEASAAAHH